MKAFEIKHFAAILLLAIVSSNQMRAFSLTTTNAVENQSDRVDKSDSTIVDRSRVINGHRFVDLGLPSGLLWAETNLGASKPEDAGDYYAWGETSKKSSYNEDNSKTYGCTYNNILPATEDAATVNWGKGVRMPTIEDFEELFDACTVSLATRNGKKGHKVVSTINGNELFFPAVGCRYSMVRQGYGKNGSYWTSVPDEDIFAGRVMFSQDGSYDIGSKDRSCGRSIRAVAD